jgi:hypothetical protein
MLGAGSKALARAVGTSSKLRRGACRAMATAHYPHGLKSLSPGGRRAARAAWAGRRGARTQAAAGGAAHAHTTGRRGTGRAGRGDAPPAVLAPAPRAAPSAAAPPCAPLPPAAAALAPAPHTHAADTSIDKTLKRLGGFREVALDHASAFVQPASIKYELDGAGAGRGGGGGGGRGGGGRRGQTCLRPRPGPPSPPPACHAPAAAASPGAPGL